MTSSSGNSPIWADSDGPADANEASPTPKKIKATKSPRVWFVDVLRLIASFQMVNGHTLDAVMLTSIRHGVFYDRYLWFRGLVSVTFLAVAGIAFHLSTLCRFEKHKSNPAAVRRRFRRAAVIILVGYLLSFPWGAFNQDPEIRRASWDYFRSVDVLHCIGAALIMLELITVFARTARQVVLASAGLALACLFLAPSADALLAPEAKSAWLNWLSHQGGSQFPIFPWAGFVFAGLILGAWAMPQGGATAFRLTLSRLISALVFIMLAWAALREFGNPLFDASRHHPSTSPFLSIEKLAAVLGLIVFLALACRPLRTLPKFLRALSSETLVIYAFHLVVLYYPGIAIGRRLEKSLELPAALGVSLFMLLFTGAFTLAWHHLQKRRAKS